MLSPEVGSAAVIESFSKNYTGDQVSFTDMIEVIKDSTKKLTQDNSMQYVERLLLSQSILLNGMFVSLARKVAVQDGLKQYETHMRLALKAQSQCRATLETLSAVKNPHLYANTANIAHNQQINNGVPPAQPQQPIKKALTHEQGEPLPNQIKEKQEAIS
ncbi:MAG: hypothetical protein H7Z73_05980 [Candidatus Saccharibacteria bacterium]|nr:hypothetical protein [Moraxellaceae bacterium]